MPRTQTPDQLESIISSLIRRARCKPTEHKADALAELFHRAREHETLVTDLILELRNRLADAEAAREKKPADGRRSN